MSYDEPLTQVQVEQRIARITNQMEKQLERLAELTSIAAEAEADYKVGFAKAILKAGARTDGTGRGGRLTEGDKEATAIVEVERLLRDRLIAEAHRDVAQEGMRTMRTSLDALRTISANIRSVGG